MGTRPSGVQKPHICLISGAYPPVRCGVGDYTARLAKALARAGARVSVVTSTAVHMPEKNPGVSVFPVISAWNARHLPELGRRLQALKPDSVHLMYPSLGFGRGWAPNLILGYLAKRLPTCARVLTLHEYAMFSKLGRWRLRPALVAAQVVVCTNHQDRRALRRERELRARVRVIPLGSAVAPDPSASRAVKFNHRAATCVTFGTVMPNKGWETLLRAWQGLRRETAGLKLAVVGALEPERYAYHARVAREIKALDLSQDIRFTGYLAPADVQRVFKNSLGLAVMPFQPSALLNRSSLVAALCAGLAVVTTRPAQALEGLRHGENIWLVTPGDPAALAEGVRRVAADKLLRQRLQSGALRAARRFAWTRIARQTLALVSHREGMQ
ncbi:MAG: glycosyltransferase [Candidatus Firestonebacteria bacterium]|nr:glycosyltransferase [Candidatus Firestonebacteria bacterium]